MRKLQSGYSTVGLDCFAVDFYCYRSLEELHIDYHSPAFFFAHQNAADALQSAFFDADSLADAQVGPGLDAAARFDHGLDCGYFGLRHRRWGLAETDDRQDARRAQDLQPILVRKAAEDIAG